MKPPHEFVPILPALVMPAETPNLFLRRVDAEFHGIRIDSFLVRQFRNYTPFRMQRMIRAGAAAIDGTVVPLRRRVFRGDDVAVRLIEPPDKLLEPEPLPVDVLFEDEHLVAVDKPAGQIAHPVGRRQSATLCNALQHHFDRQTSLRGILRPGIVHRLDRLTSGAMVVAKSFLAHKRLSIQFQRNEVRKTYLAVVEGNVADDAGTIDRPIGLSPGGGSILMSAGCDARNPRAAFTEFAVLQRRGDSTLLSVVPRTGRIHQIRVHLAAIGHPVCGDEFYGPFGEIRAERFASTGDADERNAPAGRHLLHALQIAFAHPATREPLALEAPPPPEFAAPTR